MSPKSSLTSVGDVSWRVSGARAGIAAIERADYAAAVHEFSRMLRSEPTNPHLHYLNALAYHLWAESGNPAQYAQAAVGYRLALRFDPGNAWAPYQLGRVELARRNFAAAEDAFGEALLIDRENHEFHYALAAAAYYSGDLDTALGAVHELERLQPGQPATLRAGAMIHAAVGEFPKARAAVEAFELARNSDAKKHRGLEARVRDWERFHAAQVQFAKLSDEAGAPATGTSAGSAAATPTPRPGPKMVQIDAVLIRSEERISSRKGVNLLDGLRMTFNATPIDWSRDWTRDPALQSDAQTLRLTTSDLTYSLNIFNDTDTRNEVLAQPSLLATDNVQAEFFSGSNLYVAVSPGNLGSDPSLEQVKIGLRIAVQPRFIDDNTIELSATVERDFIEPATQSGAFNEFVQTASTHVTTHATLRFNETLVVSGLSERETETERSGVPLLQSLPGAQYFFSRKDDLKFMKSVLVLLTPRQAHFIDDGGVHLEPALASDDTPSVRELKRQAEWFRPPNNLEPILRRLRHSTAAREYRLEDLPLETWHTPDRLDERMKRALGFLYY